VTTRDLRTIDKIGLVAYAKRHGVTILGACPPPRSRIAASLFTPSPVASSTGPGAFCVCTSENARQRAVASGLRSRARPFRPSERDDPRPAHDRQDRPRRVREASRRHHLRGSPRRAETRGSPKHPSPGTSSIGPGAFSVCASGFSRPPTYRRRVHSVRAASLAHVSRGPPVRAARFSGEVGVFRAEA
jgi:hypothetical protein